MSLFSFPFLRFLSVFTVLFSTTAVCAEHPWWDDFLTIIQVGDVDKAKESGADTVLCGVADDPTWGIFLQRERMKPGKETAAKMHTNGQKVMVWFEGYGTTQAQINEIRKDSNGHWLKKRDDPTLTQLFNNHWSWQRFDGTGDVHWIGSPNYFDADNIVAPWHRLHPEYGCVPMTYPDGRVAEGYEHNDVSDPRNSRVWDAGCSKNVLGNLSFEYEFNDQVNTINTETKKIAGPLIGLVEVKEAYLGPPDPGYTPEEWKSLKAAKYSGVVSVGKDTACPVWNDYLEASLKNALTIDIDGLWVDNFSPWDNFNAHPNLKAFGEWSVARFRPFLKNCIEKEVLTSNQLKDLGVVNIDTFDVRQYMQKKCKEFGGDPTQLENPCWRDPRWADDPIWRAYLVYKRQLSTEVFDRYYATVKRIAATAGKPDFFVSGNDIPMFSLGWIRGELDMVSTELTWGWHLTSGPRGLMAPPFGSYAPIAKLGREHAKSRFVNAWYYVPKEQEDKPNIARIINYQGLANHMLPMPQYSSRTLGTPEINGDFFRFVRKIRPTLRDRVPCDEQIGLYYSSSTQLMEMMPGGFRNHSDQPFSFAYYGWGTALCQSHYGWRALPQWKLTTENLAVLKILVLPNVSVFDRRQLPLLQSWVEQGGTLVLSGIFAERLDEDNLFEKAFATLDTFVPPDSNADYSEKRLGKGKIVFLKNDPGYQFYMQDKERPAVLAELKPLLEKIVTGHNFCLRATKLPWTVGISVFQDDDKMFVDLYNTNIDIGSDMITPTPQLTFDIALRQNLRGKRLKISVFSPETAPEITTKELVSDRLQLTVEPFETYACIVIE